jgi:hypothetical protein
LEVSVSSEEVEEELEEEEEVHLLTKRGGLTIDSSVDTGSARHVVEGI